MSSSRITSRSERLWPVSLKEAGRVLLLAVIVAGGNWVGGSASLPLVADPTVYELELSAPLVTIPRALELFDEGVHLFVDTRPVRPGSEPTIAGAFVIREATFDDDLLALFDVLYPEDPVILFGDGDLVGTSNVAARLQDRGYHDVQILEGGLRGWQEAGGMLGEPFVPEEYAEQLSEDAS